MPGRGRGDRGCRFPGGPARSPGMRVVLPDASLHAGLRNRGPMLTLPLRSCRTPPRSSERDSTDPCVWGARDRPGRGTGGDDEVEGRTKRERPQRNNRGCGDGIWPLANFSRGRLAAKSSPHAAAMRRVWIGRSPDLRRRQIEGPQRREAGVAVQFRERRKLRDHVLERDQEVGQTLKSAAGRLARSAHVRQCRCITWTRVAAPRRLHPGSPGRGVVGAWVSVCPDPVRGIRLCPLIIGRDAPRLGVARGNRQVAPEEGAQHQRHD